MLTTRRTEDRGRMGSAANKSLGVGSDVYVLRRGKSQDAHLEVRKPAEQMKAFQKQQVPRVSTSSPGNYVDRYIWIGRPTPLRKRKRNLVSSQHTPQAKLRMRCKREHSLV